MRNYAPAEVHLKKAEELVQSGKFYKAFEEFRKAIQLHYGYAKAHAAFGSALLEAEQYPEAVEQFLRVAEIEPAYTFDIEKLSEALNHDVRQVEDIGRFQKLIGDSHQANALHRWGQVLADINHPDEAIEQFKAALTKEPGLELDVKRLCQAFTDSATTELQVESFQDVVDMLKSPAAWNTWGKTLLALGRYGDALKQFEAIPAQDQWAESYANWGEALCKQGNYREAVNKLRLALERDDSYIPAHALLGQAYIQQEEYSEAIDAYQQAMKKAPSGEYLEPWQKAIRHLPYSQLFIDQYEEALTSVDVWPVMLPAYYNRWGEFLTSRGMLEQSVRHCALLVGVIGVIARINRPGEEFSELKKWVERRLGQIQGLVQTSVKEISNPVDTLARIQNDFPAESPESFLLWGVILARLEKDDAALEQLSRALQALSSGEQYWVWVWVWIKELLRAFRSSEHRRTAQNKVQKLVNQLKQSDQWVAWGNVLAQQSHSEREAPAALREALLLNPSTSGLVESFVSVLKRAPNRILALQEVQTAVERASRAEVFYTWGQILTELGEEQTAVTQFDQAVKRKYDFAAAYYALGRIYSQQGRYREACSQFQKAVEHQQNHHAEAMFDWGTALLKSGRQKEALQKYRQAIQMAPSTLKSLQSVHCLLKWDDSLVACFQRVVDTLSTAEGYTLWGNLLYQIGYDEQAIRQYRRAVESDRDHQDAYKNWRKAIGKAGITPERIQEFEQVIEKYPNNADAYREWGDFLLALKRFDQATEKYKKALEEKDSKSARAHVGWIRCLWQLNDVTRVREAAQRLLAYHPHHEYGYFALASAAFLNGEYDEAKEQSKVGMEQAGSSLYLQVRYAWALYKTGQEALALRELEEAIGTQSDPNLKLRAYFEYGSLLLELGRYKKAEAQFRKAIELDASFPYPYHNLAVIDFEQGQYEKAWPKWMDALNAYERREPAVVRALDNESVDGNEFYYHALVVQRIKHETEKAEEILNAGHAFDPQNTLILRGLVSLLWEKKEECLGVEQNIVRQRSDYHWQAMEYFHRAERLLQDRLKNFEDDFHLTELGELYLTVEDYEKAKCYFEKAHSKDDKEALPCAKLGVIQLRQNQPDSAIPLLKEARRLNPDNLEVQSNLAEAYRRAEKLDEAEDAYRRVLAIAPNHVQSLIGLGEVCMALSEKKDTDCYSEAIVHFAKALQVAERESIRSQYLRKQEKAAICYSLGYARVQLYENSGMYRETSVLKQALKDFQACHKLNPEHQKAIQAIAKLNDRMRYLSPQWLTEKFGPLFIFGLSIFFLVVLQVVYFAQSFVSRPALVITETTLQAMVNQLPEELLQKLETLKDQEFISEAALLNVLQPMVASDQLEVVQSLVLTNIGTARATEYLPTIETGYYAVLTFGLLLFAVVGLYLPQVLKLTVAGISLEKSSIDQSQTKGTLGISR